MMTNRVEWENIPNFLPSRSGTEVVQNQITVRMIQSVVSEYFHVPTVTMLSVRRHRDIVHARQIAYYLARELTSHSFLALARMFKKDHSTIIYGCQKIERVIATDSAFRAEIEGIKVKIMNAR